MHPRRRESANEKRITFHLGISLVILISLVALPALALPGFVYAQGGEGEVEAEPKAGQGEVEPEPKAQSDPVTVTEKHVDAVNKGDATGAGEVMAEDAVVTVPQATSGTEDEAEGEADPEAQTQYTGSAEYQAWLDAQAKANAQTTLGECSVEGERVTCGVSYTSDALRAKGVDFLEGELAVVVVEGVIQSYDFTPSPESVAKLGAAPAAPEAVPVTGGSTSPEVMPVTGDGSTQGVTYIMALLVVLGLLLAGAASLTRAFQRGAKN